MFVKQEIKKHGLTFEPELQTEFDGTFVFQECKKCNMTLLLFVHVVEKNIIMALMLQCTNHFVLLVNEIIYFPFTTVR